MGRRLCPILGSFDPRASINNPGSAWHLGRPTTQAGPSRVVRVRSVLPLTLSKRPGSCVESLQEIVA